MSLKEWLCSAMPNVYSICYVVSFLGASPPLFGDKSFVVVLSIGFVYKELSISLFRTLLVSYCDLKFCLFLLFLLIMIAAARYLSM